MKRKLFYLIAGLIFVTNSVEAHHCSSHYYVTYKDYFQEEQLFNNCNKHSMLKETTVYYYSNGTRRSYVTNTIFNQDGSVLISGCTDVKHILYKNKHYFTFYKNKKYQILDENGNYLTTKEYKKLKEIAPNRFLVKLNKKLGIIDLNENTITPIKYQKFEQIGQNLFLTKLNGYYGITDSNNKILIKNENDSIKPLYDVFIVKKQNKYRIADNKGQIILPSEYDNIKMLGEYILIKKDGKFGVLDANGKTIADTIYKKIRLERNNLEGKIAGNSWHSL